MRPEVGTGMYGRTVTAAFEGHGVPADDFVDAFVPAMCGTGFERATVPGAMRNYIEGHERE